MDQIMIMGYTVIYSVALLTLISLGLALIFGMMGVINFAHGEFLMLGGYAAVMASHAGMNIWLAMLVVAPLSVAVIGALAERILIRRLYGNVVMTMLATWGLSLFLIGLITTIFGTATTGVSAPLGKISFGIYSIGVYQLAIVGLTVSMVLGLLYVLHRTTFGLVMRATMRNRETAASIGIDPRRTYAMTFMLGAAISGLAGGLLAPLSGVIPTIGAAYIARAFVTVVAGGPALVSGVVATAGLLGPIEAVLSYLASPVVGQASLLLAAIVLLRVFPKGLSARWTGSE